MINIFDSKLQLIPRRADAAYVKPEGTEYLYNDGHSKNKFHHIIINDQGEVFYNQAIDYDEMIRKGQVVQSAGFQDFYEWAEVGCMESHGYRQYIDAALIEHNERARVIRQAKRDLLTGGESFDYWNNQGLRPAECLAVIGSEALICFEMPAGGEFLHVVKCQGAVLKHNPDKYQFVRNVSWNKIPKKWAQAAGL